MIHESNSLSYTANRLRTLLVYWINTPLWYSWRGLLTCSVKSKLTVAGGTNIVASKVLAVSQHSAMIEQSLVS